MYHSITFGNKNTWDDWKIIPTSRPLFNPPSLKEKIVDIPGANGSIDMSTFLSGGVPSFGNRVGSFQFIVANEEKSWDTLYSEIMTFLHGKRMNVWLEDDPLYYYTGRFFVDSWTSEKSFPVIVINYNVSPHRVART